MKITKILLALFLATLTLNAESYEGRGDYGGYDGRGYGEGERGFGYKKNKREKIDVRPVDNALYKKECASCHFGYQPGWLPEKSWRFIMQTLEDHYGTDASVDKKTGEELLDYVVSNSAERATGYKRSAKMLRSVEPGVLYKSITEIPYHIKKHKKIEKWMITQKEVKTLANCAACHKKADEGKFGKRSVYIPNYGEWRDD